MLYFLDVIFISKNIVFKTNKILAHLLVTNRGTNQLEKRKKNLKSLRFNDLQHLKNNCCCSCCVYSGVVVVIIVCSKYCMWQYYYCTLVIYEGVGYLPDCVCVSFVGCLLVPSPVAATS